MGGRRGQAIRTAVQEQLGLRVPDVKPVGLEGSAGSTLLRLRVAAGDGSPSVTCSPSCTPKATCAPTAPTSWAARSCTALEDEAPFHSVRRFVEYGDYTLLRLYHAGIPVPALFGFVEITLNGST